MELLIRARQRGLALLFALLALAALSLAAVALMQTVGAGAVVIGNVGFKQEATASADRAAQEAIAAIYARLSVNSTALDESIASIGYYASSDDLIDVTGRQLAASNRKLVNWQQNNCGGAVGTCAYTPVAGTPVNGNAVQYVVFRLCASPGNPATDTSIECAQPLTASSNSGMYKGAVGVGGGSSIRISESTATPYYRIVVRVAGARNTVSFTETIVHF